MPESSFNRCAAKEKVGMRKILFLLLLTTLNQPVYAQKQDSSVKLESHVLKPAKLEPSAERLRSLTLPEGFSISPFAQDLGKPRMLATAPDGSVYVTRREPGDCWLLKDTDGNGQADLRKKVRPRTPVSWPEL